MAPGATELSVSRDGSVVGFVTDQALVTDDHNETGDVYVVLRSGDGGLRAITVPGDGSSSAVEVSADGSTVAFVSAATNLVDGDTNGRDDIFVADVETGEIRRVNVDELGQQADVGLLPGGRPSLSADGLLIAFADSARLIGGAPLGDDPLVYERDLETGITRSVAHGARVSLSGDGKVLAYAGDGQVHAEIDGDAVELISATPGGEPGNARSRQPDVNDDGSLIAFASDATDLVGGGDPQGQASSCDSGASRRGPSLSRSTTSAPRAAGEHSSPALSADGRFVAFTADRDPNACGPGFGSVEVRDRADKSTFRAARGFGGQLPDGPTGGAPSVSGDGTLVGYSSSATNLIGDANGEGSNGFLTELGALGDPVVYTSEGPPRAPQTAGNVDFAYSICQPAGRAEPLELGYVTENGTAKANEDYRRERARSRSRTRRPERWCRWRCSRTTSTSRGRRST